jgi:hypothetical protein
MITGPIVIRDTFTGTPVNHIHNVTPEIPSLLSYNNLYLNNPSLLTTNFAAAIGKNLYLNNSSLLTTFFVSSTGLYKRGVTVPELFLSVLEHEIS